jgi:hypothetical protein
MLGGPTAENLVSESNIFKTAENLKRQDRLALMSFQENRSMYS